MHASWLPPNRQSPDIRFADNTNASDEIAISFGCLGDHHFLLPKPLAVLNLCLARSVSWRKKLADPHQVITIIATAIHDCAKDKLASSEEAKQIAKCVVEALSAAGLRICPASEAGT
jgi:hypothetical protein